MQRSQNIFLEMSKLRGVKLLIWEIFKFYYFFEFFLKIVVLQAS